MVGVEALFYGCAFEVGVSIDWIVIVRLGGMNSISVKRE